MFVPSDAGFAEGLSVPPEELEYFDDYSPSIAPDDAEDVRSVSLKPLSVSVFEGPDGFDWVDPSEPLLVADEGGASSDLPVFEDSGPAPQDPPVPLSSSEAQAVDDNTRCWENSWRDRPLPAVPIVELPFFVPLPTKHATAATQGVMHVVSSLRALGLPVVRLHSDRGGEFVNRTLRLFCDQHCIERTTTAGDNALDFRQNGRCENLVRRLKRQARTLLHAHGAPLDHWAFAMRHAAARLRAHALSVIGLTPPALLPWYTQVVIRTRTWHTDQWSSRATPGRVVSPSGDLHRGHLVLTADGSCILIRSLKGFVRALIPSTTLPNICYHPCVAIPAKALPMPQLPLRLLRAKGEWGRYLCRVRGRDRVRVRGRMLKFPRLLSCILLSLSLKRKPLDL